jgi:hypothetical protein
MPPFNLWVGTSMHDGVPFMINNRINGREFIVCLHPRAANINLKFLFRAASSKRKYDWTMTDVLSEHPGSKQTARTPDMQKAFMKKDVPRIMIVRNPYMRLLSSFLAEILGNKDMNAGPKDYHMGESFEIFVEKLIKHHADPEKIDFQNPFKLQSKNCLLSDGMTYDYYLPIEQMDFWYEPLLDSLDIVPFTRTDWNITTPHYQGKPDQPCFYRAFNRTCEQMFLPIDYGADHTTLVNADRLIRNRRLRRRRKLQSEKSAAKSSSSNSVQDQIESLQKIINSLQEQIHALKALTSGTTFSSASSSATPESITTSSAVPPKKTPTGPPPPFDIQKLIPKEGYKSYYNETHMHLTNYYRLYYSMTLNILKKYFKDSSYHYQSQGTIEKFGEFYNSESLIEKVTEWVMPDLQEYHYPVWNPGTMTYQDYLYALYMEMPKTTLEQD